MNEMSESGYALQMDRVGMRFGQVLVLRDVTVNVRRGSVHAIVGHNGAGKSTLMKIALGAQAPTHGEVRVDGRRLAYNVPAEARALGLGMVMQEGSLIDTLSGLDNLFLNAERLNRARLVSVQRERSEVMGLIQDLGIAPALLSTPVSEMSAIEQKLIEIARALRLGDKVLILDEPTAPLGRAEIDRLFFVLRKIATRGTGIVIITHHLPEVFAISDEVTCLRGGVVTLSCRTAETAMPELIAAILGQHPRGAAGRATGISGSEGVKPAGSPRAAARPPVLSVRGLHVGHKLADVSFDAFPGEIVGVVGLAGSGRTTLLRTLFGDLQASRGEILVRGKRYRPRSPHDAMARGVFLVPEDRGVHGLMLSKSIAENLVLVMLRRLISGVYLLRFREGREAARRMMATLGIRASSVDQVVSELSGGNQQKVVLAKALTLGADLLLLDEPTFGVDIGASREIISHVRALASRDTTILWASSDLLEVAEVADRILILRDGIAGAILDRADTPEFREDSLVALMQRRQIRNTYRSFEANLASH